MRLTLEQRTTILAALRWWQMDLTGRKDFSPEDEMPEFFTDMEALSAKEIDDLCESFNCEEEAEERAAC